MMSNKLIITAIFLLCFISSYTQNTDSLLAKYITSLRNFYELNPAEKCFLHSDKQFYQPGETVWFKSYLTLNNYPSKLSSVVYTDFSDANGKLYSKAMWKVEGGTATGNIFIPDTLQTGIYRIRSYSLWMLNEPQFVGEQMIFILGKKDQTKVFYLPVSNLIIDFFPEGGQLITNVLNRIAVKITDANKMPVTNITVQLVDDANLITATPLVFENGIGMFEFTPLENKKYRLQVNSNSINQTYFPLPAAISNGINMVVSNLSTSKIFVQANASESFINANSFVYIIAQQFGKTVFAQKFNLEESQNATVLNKKMMSPGLLQLSLFNSQLQPLAERWVWVDEQVAATISLIADTVSFEPKHKNSYTVTFDGTDTPTLSVSVIPADLPSYNFVFNPTITSYQYIHSNNNGIPLFCNYLINKENENYLKWLDAVFLTINPARFSWQQIIEGKQKPLNYFFETGISVRGYVSKDKENMHFDSSKVDVITKGADSTSIFSTAKIDNKGAFAVNDLHFRKSATIFVQATTKEKKKRKVNYELQPGYIDTLSTEISKAFFNPKFLPYPSNEKFNESFLKNYSVSLLGKELSEIVIKGKNKAEVRLDSLNNAITTDIFRNSEFSKAPDSGFNYISFSQLFAQEFFGFRFNQGYDRIGGMDGTPASGLASGDMISYYLNEQPISSEELNFIDPGDVILLKVNRNANLHLGQMGPGPSVLIYTRSKGNKGKSGFNSTILTGYSIPLTYYIPDYPKPEYQKTEDRRTTLLWQPIIKFDNYGKAKIQFYNNDYTKKFKVVIQGMDKNGNLFYLEKIIE